MRYMLTEEERDKAYQDGYAQAARIYHTKGLAGLLDHSAFTSMQYEEVFKTAQDAANSLFNNGMREFHGK